MLIILACYGCQSPALLLGLSRRHQNPLCKLGKWVPAHAIYFAGGPLYGCLLQAQASYFTGGFLQV